MQALSLSETELHETLARAREIADRGGERVAPDVAFDAYVQAAEEMGIPREAILQALRERSAGAGFEFAEGQRVFAPSLDGFWYPARIVNIGDLTAVVKFDQGESHSCAMADLRPLALIPGRKLEVDWPGWGWWTVTVESYDAESGALCVTDGWSSKRLSLNKVRLPSRIASPAGTAERRLAAVSRAALIRCGVLAGGAGLAAGVLLDRLLPWLLAFLR
jgi:hypothetical protein